MSQQQWTSDDVPFIAIGSGLGKDGKPANHPQAKKLQGKYLYTTRMKIKGRTSTIHRMEFSESDLKDDLKDKDGNVITAGQEVNLFGSGSINGRLSRLPEGTPVRFTYEGEKDVGKDSPLKMIKVEWPKGTKLKAPPKVKQTVEREPGEDEDDDDVNF